MLEVVPDVVQLVLPNSRYLRVNVVPMERPGSIVTLHESA